MEHVQSPFTDFHLLLQRTILISEPEASSLEEEKAFPSQGTMPIQMWLPSCQLSVSSQISTGVSIINLESRILADVQSKATCDVLHWPTVANGKITKAKNPSFSSKDSDFLVPLGSHANTDK